MESIQALTMPVTALVDPAPVVSKAAETLPVMR